MEARRSRSLPLDALELVLPFVSSHKDRNSVSLVCKAWYNIERWSRHHVRIRNCYAVSQSTLTRRFTDVRSITIKANRYTFVTDGSGAPALPWISALAGAYSALEEIRLEEIVVTDQDLKLIARKFPDLKVLVLKECRGFSSQGLSAIAADCRNLKTLDLDSDLNDLAGDWISNFREDNCSLEFLNISWLELGSPVFDLERLFDRSSNLNTMLLNRHFPLENLIKLVQKAPRLVSLGVGSFRMKHCQDAFKELATAFARCEGLKDLSFSTDIDPYYLPAIYPACSRLTFLDLRYSNLRCSHYIKLLSCCPNLQRLWVWQYIEDRGLQEVAKSCKELEELRVLNHDNKDDSVEYISECGLVSVVMGCPNLHAIEYECNKMTNAALNKVAMLIPNLTSLIIHSIHTQFLDYLNEQPFDKGFSAIAEHCKNLKQLSIGVPFTDQLLHSIGTHGKKLEKLWLVCGKNNSDIGLHHVLSACTNLRKLYLTNSLFDGLALLTNSDSLEKMQFLYMTSYRLSDHACKLLRVKHPRLNVEVMNKPFQSSEDGDEDEDVDEDEGRLKYLYVYRTIAGGRLDLPAFVCSSNEMD